MIETLIQDVVAHLELRAFREDLGNPRTEVAGLGDLLIALANAIKAGRFRKLFATPP